MPRLDSILAQFCIIEGAGILIAYFPSSNDSSAGNSDRDNDPDLHLIEDGASSAPLLIPSIVIPITAAPLDSTPFRNDTITDATLDAKFLEHRAKCLSP